MKCDRASCFTWNNLARVWSGCGAGTKCFTWNSFPAKSSLCSPWKARVQARVEDRKTDDITNPKLFHKGRVDQVGGPSAFSRGTLDTARVRHHCKEWLSVPSCGYAPNLSSERSTWNVLVGLLERKIPGPNKKD